MLIVEIYKDHNDEYRSRIKARNGRILFDSGEGYKRKASARRGVDALCLDSAQRVIERDLTKEQI